MTDTNTKWIIGIVLVMVVIFVAFRVNLGLNSRFAVMTEGYNVDDNCKFSTNINPLESSWNNYQGKNPNAWININYNGIKKFTYNSVVKGTTRQNACGRSTSAILIAQNFNSAGDDIYLYSNRIYVCSADGMNARYFSSSDEGIFPTDCESNPAICTPFWSCSSWSTCLNNVQTRTCTDTNICGVTTDKPTTSQSCSNTCTQGDKVCVDSDSYKTCLSSNQWSGLFDCASGKFCNNGVCIESCTQIWQCSDWGICLNGNQTRTCTDLNNCNSNTKIPTTQSCTPICTPSWICTTWGVCSDENQIRTCNDLNNCGLPITDGLPTSQPCNVTICTPNWKTGDWTICSGGAQTRTTTDLNNCGTTSGQPSAYQSCITCSFLQKLEKGECVTNSIYWIIGGIIGLVILLFVISKK